LISGSKIDVAGAIFGTIRTANLSVNESSANIDIINVTRYIGGLIGLTQNVTINLDLIIISGDLANANPKALMGLKSTNTALTATNITNNTNPARDN